MRIFSEKRFMIPKIIRFKPHTKPKARLIIETRGRRKRLHIGYTNGSRLPMLFLTRKKDV